VDKIETGHKAGPPAAPKTGQSFKNVENPARWTVLCGQEIAVWFSCANRGHPKGVMHGKTVQMPVSTLDYKPK